MNTWNVSVQVFQTAYTKAKVTPLHFYEQNSNWLLKVEQKKFNYRVEWRDEWVAIGRQVRSGVPSKTYWRESAMLGICFNIEASRSWIDGRIPKSKRVECQAHEPPVHTVNHTPAVTLRVSRDNCFVTKPVTWLGRFLRYKIVLLVASWTFSFFAFSPFDLRSTRGFLNVYMQRKDARENKPAT